MIRCVIADLHFSVEAIFPLVIDERYGLQGFVNEHVTSHDVDFRLRLHDGLNFPKIEPTRTFLCDLPPAEPTPWTHTYTLSIFADHSEMLDVTFRNHPWLHRAVMIMRGREVDIFLRRKNSDVVNPYIFPLLNISLSRLVQPLGGVQIHSSVVDDDGRGYLFTAVSGTGKSTMARLWQDLGATIINDDMNVVRPTQQADNQRSTHFKAYNIPMPNYLDKSRSTTLHGIFLIEQSKENFVERLNVPTAAVRLHCNALNHPLDEFNARCQFRNTAAIAEVVPVFRLGFKPDSDVVKLVRNLNL